MVNPLLPLVSGALYPSTTTLPVSAAPCYNRVVNEAPLHRRLLDAISPPDGRDPAVRAAAVVQDVRRIRWASVAVGLVNLIHVIVFAALPATTAAEASWQQGLVWAHTGLALCVAGLHLWARRAGAQPGTRFARLLPSVAMVCGLAATIIIVVIDQWVTTSITPFLIGAALAALLVVLPPSISLPLFGAAFVGFALAIGLTQTEPNALLSNRLNGIAAVVFGALLSVLSWRRHVESFVLQRETARAHTELLETRDRFAHLAAHDPLTGLYNRLEFAKLAERELARAHRQKRPTCLIALDLDHFKAINDAFGHPGGDAALVHVAATLRAGVRSFDISARMGGEEFAVLLPETALDDAVKVAERLREQLARSPAVLADGRRIPLAASLGVVCEVGAGTFERLYSAADKALYAAKGAGRNRVHASGTWV
jgi:diguanylate cyclase (GGDEF)-like protein